MVGTLSEDELRRLQKFTDTPRYARNPEMLLPDDEDERDDE